MQSLRPEQDRSTRPENRATMAAVAQPAVTLPGALDDGTEWLVDAAGCDARLLSDLGHLQETCAQLVDALWLRVIGEPHWHQFPAADGSDGPGGVTGLYLLSESHLACHTFPEEGRATFNLYCCRRRPAWDWQDFLARRLGAVHVLARSVARGPVANDTRREEPLA
jgi:S-adenosylmethionine decarboxylase